MLFNSLEFLLFFPIVTLSYFILPSRFRWILLLIASYVFYMFWNPIYIVLIIFSTLVDYIAGLMMGKYPLKSIQRKWYLGLSLFSNLGLLFLFKYFNFFADIWANIVNSDFDALSLILPMGISFYTFQTLSYSIDVYKGEKTAEKHLGYFALYVSFFPQLVAGPIERSTRLLPQLRNPHPYDYSRTVEGLKRMTWGFFKKVVIADNLAIAVNHVYGNVESMSGLTLLIATIFFAFQIYNDFSGYSDIAIGTAKILGVDLMENFRQPYFATSIRDFWARWHISLSTWFRDYVYIPLGGSRKSRFRMFFNVFIVFVVSGLWHGAALTFVIWGALHGIFYIIEALSLKVRDGFWKNIKRQDSNIKQLSRWFITMAVVLVSWVFFRAETINDAIIVIEVIINSILDLSILQNAYQSLVNTQIGRIRLYVVTASILVLLLNHYLIEFRSKNIFNIFSIKPKLQWAVYYVIIFAIIIFGEFGQAEFIYFQF